MVHGYSERLEKLIKAFTRFPGIGPKSAERIVLHLLKQEKNQVKELSRLIMDAKENTFFCEACNNLSDQKVCHICADLGRDQSTICVVEEPKDVASVERSGVHRGIYYVLLGALSPLEGVGPQELRLDRFVKRVREGIIKEVILATNPNTEGDVTAMYLANVLKQADVKMTRIARGIPVGSHIEYVDQVTLGRALEGRTIMV
jgi:recombination protein RecR